eukprot:354406-Chlamydomonas_euryale.AAC.7
MEPTLGLPSLHGAYTGPTEPTPMLPTPHRVYVCLVTRPVPSAHLCRNDASEVLGERHREVAIAAIELQQVVVAAALGHVDRPRQHLLTHARVGLAERAFVLAVHVLPPGHAEPLLHVIALQQQLLFARAPDDVRHVAEQRRRARRERRAQARGRLRPCVV